ncbi:MAG: iron-sulfur cluster assembly scaffold protein [Polyangia bacterium]
MSQPLAPELARLYQETILEHNARPRNLGELPGATHEARLHNPLCGDQVTLRLVVSGEGEGPGEGARITAARFVGDSCALCRASASLLTLRVTADGGLGPAGALALGAALRHAVTPGLAPAAAGEPPLGELQALTGVRDVPSRRRCATLPWEALEQALAPGPKRA